MLYKHTNLLTLTLNIISYSWKQTCIQTPISIFMRDYYSNVNNNIPEGLDTSFFPMLQSGFFLNILTCMFFRSHQLCQDTTYIASSHSLTYDSNKYRNESNLKKRGFPLCHICISLNRLIGFYWNGCWVLCYSSLLAHFRLEKNMKRIYW